MSGLVTLIFKQQIKEGANQTVRCAGWSASFLFASIKDRVSPVEAYMMLKARFPGLCLAMCLKVIIFFMLN